MDKNIKKRRLNLTPLFRLFSLGMLMTGCVTRQPAYDKEGICLGNSPEFSWLGQTWNTASYGTLGVPYGAVKSVYDSYQDTNQTSAVVNTLKIPYTAVKGMGEYAWKGMEYGYHLKYATGRSVEGHVFDVIDHTTDCMFYIMKELGR